MQDLKSKAHTPRHRPLAAVLLCCLLAMEFGLAASTQAFAQSAQCRALRAQLSAIETGRGLSVSPRYEQYNRAVREQQIQLQKTERAARRNGCQIRRSAVCDRINASLAAMVGNLENLQHQRDRLAPRGATAGQRAQVIGAMRAAGCDGGEPLQASRRDDNDSGRRTLLEQIFGTKTYSDRDAYGEFDARLNARYGTYRTLCVRTCDGYYFPISFSTTGDHFGADAAQCNRMCPGADTELFFHPMPGGDAEQAISYRTGAAYGDLPSAFAYRDSVDPNCTCRTANGGFDALEGTIQAVTPLEDEAQESEPGETLPVPRFRVDRDVDLDGLALAEGGVTADALKKLAQGKNDVGEDPRSAKIRIVGPAFFPVQ